MELNYIWPNPKSPLTKFGQDWPEPRLAVRVMLGIIGQDWIPVILPQIFTKLHKN